MTPKTLTEAIRYFADPDVALKLVAELRWPNGVTCPGCGSKEVRFLATRRLWECKTKHPKRQFSVKVGTIFEDSPIGLDKWLAAIWMLANCKNGISSYEVHRALGITQKSAWFMLHRIRLAMQDGTIETKIGGPGKTVEVDETFIGGAARWMSKSRHKKAVTAGGPHASGKTIVQGMLERRGRIHVTNLKQRTLLGNIVKNVNKGSEVHTDENMAYGGLTYPTWGHEVVNHAVEYVRGHVHTNGIENFWSLLKRGLRGTYISVEPFHLFRYLDEQAFRFNERKDKDGDRGRFLKVAADVFGKRLTYKRLTGKLAGAEARC
jgi:transposase-like protein